MSKICYIGNFPSHYRGPIFKLLDQKFDIEWHFLRQNTSIKSLDLSILKNAILEDGIFFSNSWYFQRNIVKLIFRNDFTSYLFVGEPYSISTWILARLLKLFKKNTQISFWSHGWYGKESKIKKIIKKLFFKPADVIFLYGKRAKQLMINEGFDENKLVVVHNSLNHEAQLICRNNMTESSIYKDHFQNNYINLLFIGRLTKVKHLDILIESLAELNSKRINYNLTLIGDGEEKNKLLELSSKLGLLNNIWFYGESYEEMNNAELIYNADICISPGNVGLTAMHSLVYGTPVITHNDYSWQMPEFEAIIPNQTGDFFERGSVPSLTETIQKWVLNNHLIRQRIRQNCYNIIDNYWTPEFQLKIFSKYLK